MTYHQAKGLEFKNVFMIAMEQGIFPNSNVTNEELEEERRICYVGITRAKEHLYLSSAINRYMFGHKEQHLRSCYIDEIGDSNLNQVGLVRNTMPKPIVKEEPKNEEVKVVNDLAIGDIVNHKIYGKGRVVEVKGKIASIAFPAPTGIKKMLKDHPSITKE